jgi:hypothetical protein
MKVRIGGILLWVVGNGRGPFNQIWVGQKLDLKTLSDEHYMKLNFQVESKRCKCFCPLQPSGCSRLWFFFNAVLVRQPCMGIDKHFVSFFFLKENIEGN